MAAGAGFYNFGGLATPAAAETSASRKSRAVDQQEADRIARGYTSQSADRKSYTFQ